MASIIEGYNYDIFISYRQKDNKYDGGVTELVDNLKKELESTFKEEISVYFDINPHDGLLETHDVGASLKEKLKCLVFIPIISRTYCDPKSFAWEHEFKAFVELVSQDQFGLKVKLLNGNVASRVLPIRIHDLDPDDINLCESVLGGVLRGVEFIYKEVGIDKPLAPGDNEKKNLNNTTYRIQIIKVAHAIKEIIQGMKAEPGKEKIQHGKPLEEVKKEEKVELQENPTKSVTGKSISTVVVLGVLIIAAVLAYQKIFKKNTLEKLRSSGDRISVAVMPFINMTGDSSWNKWQESIQMNLTSSISNSKELLVRQTELINGIIQNKSNNNYAEFTPSIANSVSQKLDANVFIYGNISRAGKILRINSQLINTETKNILKSFQIETSFVEDSIFQLINALSTQMNDYLVLSLMKQKDRPDFRNFESTNSPKAYLKYISGWESFGKQDNISARNNLLEAVKIDSNFTLAEILLSVTDLNLGRYVEGKEYCLKAYEKRDKLSDYLRLKVEDINAWYTDGPLGRIKFLKQLIEIDDQNPANFSSLGNAYRLTAQYEQAIPYFKKSLEINEKLNLKPFAFYYTQLGECLHNTGQYNKENRLYKKAEINYPNNSSILSRQIVLALSKKDTFKANKLIAKYINIRKDNSEAEANILTSLAAIYKEADMLEEAEQYYRKARELDPNNPLYLNNLAYFLIDNDQNIKEGLELVDKALEFNPENFSYLHAKGWGLYKQGKYNKALEILQESWELRKKNAIYNHPAYLHLEAAKKAVTNQKNN